MGEDRMGQPIIGSIYSAEKPAGITQPFLVTVQMQFKVEARDQLQAIMAIKRHLSMGNMIAPYLITMGEDAQPMTAELLEQMGIKL